MNGFQSSACSCLIAFSLRKKCFSTTPQSLGKKRYIRALWSNSKPFFYSVVHDASGWTKEGVRKKSARREILTCCGNTRCRLGFLGQGWENQPTTKCNTRQCHNKTSYENAVRGKQAALSLKFPPSRGNLISLAR